MMQRLTVPWDACRPPSTIHQVWDYLSNKLRKEKEHFRHAVDEFYGKCERMTYVSAVNDALKVCMDVSKEVQQVGTHLELEALLIMDTKDVVRPRQLQKSQEVLKTFSDKTKIAMGRLAETRCNLEQDIFQHLEKYCSKYTKLGIADDEFYKSLKTRTVSAKDTLKDFDKIISGAKQSLAISHKYFSDKEFSQEIAFEFDCDTFPVLRIIPDLVQKLEAVFDIAQDWLRSDKVYLEQVQREMEKTGEKVKEFDAQAQLIKLEYDRMFSLLKQKQVEMDDYDETYDHLWKGLSKLDVIKTKIEMEISAVGKTLRNCRDQLRDLHSVEQAHGNKANDCDELDGTVPEDEFDFEMTSVGHAHLSYKSRLCKDARAHSTKIDYLRKKKKRVEKKIAQKKDIIQELESSESDIQNLSKKLRSLGKKKTKLTEESVAQKTHYEALRLTLESRLHPSSRAASGCAHRPPKVPGKRAKNSRRPTGSGSRTKSRNSADLHKAFRVVKNAIGHSWKDLLRVLPYSPEKPSAEINNEIRVIEYENQGQLKEQAYQAMLKWHNHNGRRASVDKLKDGLREISENRLADHIEKHVMIRQESASSSGP